MKKIIYTALLLLMVPVLSFSQKAFWQKTSDGRSVLTDKNLNNTSNLLTKTDIFDDEQSNRSLVKGAIFYIRNSEPWGDRSNNVFLLNEVFGAGNYRKVQYSIDPLAVFNSSTSIVYLEGSDENAEELSQFLDANINLIEAWVSAGGHLFMNAAPNEGGNINFGFGGTLLNFDGAYSSASFTGNLVSGQEGHAIFNGPYSPVGDSWSGNYFTHGSLTGGSATPLITGTEGTVLSLLYWGDGFVFFGGMTTANFHSPQPQANNLRANIYAFLGEIACAAPYNLKVENVGATYAVLSFSAPLSTVNNYLVGYKVAGGVKPTYYQRKDTSGTRIILKDLLPNTTYKWAIRSNCGNGDKSYPIEGPGFTTLPAAGITSNIKIFPNPVRNTIHIEGLPANQNTKLSILDFAGTARLTATPTVQTFDWNVASLRPGSYLLKVETDKSVVTLRFVKE